MYNEQIYKTNIKQGETYLKTYLQEILARIPEACYDII